MRKQSIFHQANVTHSELKKLKIENRSLTVWALKIRENIQEKLQKYPFGKDELGIIYALLLGDKQFISKDLQGNYAAAGAVHILAVSGLHIGVLFLILSFLFKPLEKLKHGKLITGIILLIFLWIFALIAGMSGSVVRAVTMFSFITIGMLLLNRKSSILYALFTSFFLLLFLNPLFIFDVGFQLSYLAVLGIVLFQPKIDLLIPEIHWTFLKKSWQLVSVSVAATLSTLPLSLYYFHQFPGLFVLSNLVIVPALGIILGLGLLIIGLAIFNILPNFLVYIYNTLLHWMNLFIEWIANQENFLFREIPFSFGMVLVTYLLIAMGYRWVLDKNLRKFQTYLVAILLFQTLLIYEKWEVKNTSELVIFHKSKETLVGIKEGTSLKILHSKDTINPNSYAFLTSYKVYNKIDSTQFNKLRYNILPTNNPILIIDSLGIYQNISNKPQIILLTQSSKINLERLIKIHQPKKIIADGSSYPYLVEKWKTTCEKAHIPFHYTGKDGAITLSVK
jgi:competence protein ComEC